MDRAPGLQDFPSETRDTPRHEGPGYDYKELAREVLARIDQRLADIERDTPPHPSELHPSEMQITEFHSETVSGLMSSDDQAAFVRLARRGLVGLLLSASVVAAISFVWSHSETASWIVTQWVPQFVLSSMMPAEKQEPAPPPPATPQATADAAPAQAAPLPRPAPDAAPLPRTAPDYDKPNPAPVSPELTELMRKVDRNIAGLAQAVTELRLAQQQAAGDNARTVGDIKASVDQMARAVVRASERAAPPPAAPAAPTSRAAAPRNRRFVPIYLSPSYAVESETLR